MKNEIIEKANLMFFMKARANILVGIRAHFQELLCCLVKKTVTEKRSFVVFFFLVFDDEETKIL